MRILQGKQVFVPETCKVAIHLEKAKYKFLQDFSKKYFQKDVTGALAYLLKKYYGDLQSVSIVEKKRIFTAAYQPKSKTYHRYKISVSPVLWYRLFDLRKQLGYSISFIIRFLLEWEMESRGSFPPLPSGNVSLQYEEKRKLPECPDIAGVEAAETPEPESEENGMCENIQQERGEDFTWNSQVPVPFSLYHNYVEIVKVNMVTKKVSMLYWDEFS